MPADDILPPASPAAAVPPRMTILPDHPILDSKRGAPDGLALEPKLGSVLDILRHKSTLAPTAIAIYGGWGTGKTSAMRWLDRQLQAWNSLKPDDRQGHAAVETVWFDPWKYHSREDVWRGLIAEIILRCIDAANLTTENAGQRLYQAAKQFGRFLGRSFLRALSNISIKAKVKTPNMGAEAETEVELSGKVFQDVYDEYRKTAHPEKAFLNDFESTLRKWVEDFFPQESDDKKAPRRLAVFIDDLDRCLPEVTLEVLEALKLYLNIPGLLFVVGLDREVVDAVVKKHYEDHGLGENKSRDYLNKMFQVEIDIAPTQTEAHNFLESQIGRLNEATGGYWSQMLDGDREAYRDIIKNKIEKLCGHNPREVKRLLNSTLLRATAAARNDALPGDEGLRFAQGAQVFLIEKFLRKHIVNSAGLTGNEDVQRFLDAWSLLARRFPDFRGGSSQ